MRSNRQATNAEVYAQHRGYSKNGLGSEKNINRAHISKIIVNRRRGVKKRVHTFFGKDGRGVNIHRNILGDTQTVTNVLLISC